MRGAERPTDTQRMWVGEYINLLKQVMTRKRTVRDLESQAEAGRRQAIGAGVSNDELRDLEHALERGDL